MMKPSIHLNGTSRGDLFDAYVDALVAVEAAIGEIGKTHPHGRDYYPQGDDAFDKARAEHSARLEALNKVANELHRLSEHCS